MGLLERFKSGRLFVLDWIDSGPFGLTGRYESNAIPTGSHRLRPIPHGTNLFPARLWRKSGHPRFRHAESPGDRASGRPSAAAVTILDIRNLSRSFGGLVAVSDLSFSVGEGEIRGLIGPNGAGKTTTFNVISGFYPPSAGCVLFRGEDVSGMRTSAIAARGLVRTFQATTLFQELTVLENVLVGCHLHARTGPLQALIGGNRRQEAAARDKAIGILDFFGLSERGSDPAMSLPHGLQRALGVAVAFAADPGLLLLDEPFTGMNPEETRRMMEIVRRVRDRGVTLLLVEHDMQAVMGLCDRITVLDFGRLLTEGTPDEVRRHPDVIEAYLGAATDAA